MENNNIPRKALGKGLEELFNNEPLDFNTNGGQMIPGFDLMVQEMKLNETRKMVIPPELAYGSRGIPQAGIEGDSYICFDVKLIKIE